MISGRKNIQDNNNYINKYGKITHICKRCGNLYTANIKLNVECDMVPCDDKTGYAVGTPVISKMCNCGASTMEIDNAMGNIYKMLFDKGYEILSGCEGHAYNQYGVMSYSYPEITIDDYIKVYIPESYQKQFDITQEFAKTIIRAKEVTCECGCICLELYNEYKTDMLERMYNMVKSLPVNPNNTNASSGCSCGYDNCDCQCSCE